MIIEIFYLFIYSYLFYGCSEECSMEENVTFLKKAIENNKGIEKIKETYNNFFDNEYNEYEIVKIYRIWYYDYNLLGADKGKLKCHKNDSKKVLYKCLLLYSYRLKNQDQYKVNYYLRTFHYKPKGEKWKIRNERDYESNVIALDTFIDDEKEPCVDISNLKEQVKKKELVNKLDFNNGLLYTSFERKSEEEKKKMDDQEKEDYKIEQLIEKCYQGIITSE